MTRPGQIPLKSGAGCADGKGMKGDGMTPDWEKLGLREPDDGDEGYGPGDPPETGPGTYNFWQRWGLPGETRCSMCGLYSCHPPEATLRGGGDEPLIVSGETAGGNGFYEEHTTLEEAAAHLKRLGCGRPNA